MGANLISVILWVAVIIGTSAGIYLLFQRIKKRKEGSTSRLMQPTNGETAHSDEDLSGENTIVEDAWERKDYERLFLLLKKDSPFPVGFSLEEVNANESVSEELKRFVEGRERLHSFIRKGDLASIKDFTQNNKSSIYYSTDNVSALSRAIEYQKKEICSHFSAFRKNFRIPESVIKNNNWPHIRENSHIHKLVHATKFSQKPDREEYDAIINMYLELNKNDEISWLMKVIQNEDFEVSLAIKSEIVITEEYGIPTEVFGFTEKNGRILIAGKGITNIEGYKNVYRVFSHELCHLAMNFMYNNDFNPYHPDDEKRKSALSVICDEVYNELETMDTLIQKVYKRYGKSQWKSELIVRIPEIVAVYGKEKSSHIFKEQIPKLHEYYVQHIIKDCEKFSDSIFYTRELLNLKNISNDHLAVRAADIRFSPFVEPQNYEDYFIPWKYRGYKFFLLPTTNPKLCAMHVFYEFKRRFPLHADRSCLAFKLEHYYEYPNGQIISDAFMVPAFKKLILLLHNKVDDCGSERIFDDIYFGSTEEKEVIVVVSEELCDKHPEWKVERTLNYHWRDFSKKFQEDLLEKEVIYQGDRTSLEEVLKEVEKTEMITPDILEHIMSKDEIRIGEGFSSVWNDKDLYIERTFVRHVYKKENFLNEQLPLHFLYITGDSENQLIELISRKDVLQTIEPESEIEAGKYIFLPKYEQDHAKLFRNVFSKIERKEKPSSGFWIHNENGKYLLRESLGIRDETGKFFQEELMEENKIVVNTQRTRVVLVADDSGSGKSTSVRSLMEKMKNRYPEKYICRVNFAKHLKESSDPLSLHSVKDSSKEILAFFQQVCKVSNHLQEKLFQSLQAIPGRIVVFFDGYDEISPNLQRNALRLLKTLNNSTLIQMWVLTRKHERLGLELELDSVSYSFCQFSMNEQCKYLNNFWRRSMISLDPKKEDLGKRFQDIVKNLENLKCGGLLDRMKEVVILIEKDNLNVFQKKINDLDFSDYSITVINAVEEIILRGQLIVPLWLWMMANIILNSNLKIPDQRDRFTFYTDFMEKKVDLFLRTKCNMASESRYQVKEYNRRRKWIFERLWSFSDRVIRSELYDKKPRMEKDDLEELVDIGLVRKEGEDYHFFHMTFAKYFFSQMIVKENETGDLPSVNGKLLSDILLKKSYLEIRLFLGDFLEKNENQFPKTLLQDFEIIETYSKFCSINCESYGRFRDRAVFKIWRRIFQYCDVHMKESVNDDSISKIFDFYPFQFQNHYTTMLGFSSYGLLDVLNFTLTDRILCTIFDLHVDWSYKLLYICLVDINSNELTAILNIFQTILSYKKLCLQSGVSSTDDSHGNGLKIFEKEYTNEDYSFPFPRKSKINIYLVSSFSANCATFIELLRFASKFMKEKNIPELLQITDGNGRSVLHWLTERRRGKVLNELREIQTVMGEGELKKLLKMQNKDGMTMLHCLMRYCCDSKDLVAILKYIEGVMEGQMFRMFLLQEDNLGRFPISYVNLRVMKTAIEFLGGHLNKGIITEMLSKHKKVFQDTIRAADCLLEEFLYLEEVLGRETFHEMVTSKDEGGETRLHRLICDEDEDKLIVRDVKVYSEILYGNSLRDFLFSQDVDGQTFLHCWADRDSGIRDINILQEFQSILVPEMYEQLLNIRNKNGETFVHVYKGAISELRCLDEVLGKEKFRDLVTAKRSDGRTRLHCMPDLLSNGEILEEIRFYAELFEEASINSFLLTKDEDGDTLLHCYATNTSHFHINIFDELQSILSPNACEQLLHIINENGETFIHVYKGQISELRFLYEFLGRERFRDLMTAKRSDGCTRLHCISENLSDHDFLNEFLFYLDLLDESLLRDLLLTKNEFGKTFVMHSEESQIKTHRNLKILQSILPFDLIIELFNTVEEEGEPPLPEDTDSRSISTTLLRAAFPGFRIPNS